LSGRLFDSEFAPKQAVSQLCSSTIIRDEHIARLSLDLKESDRFTLLRDAIGAVDAEEWIKRAQALASSASSHSKEIGVETDQAKRDLVGVTLQLDQARAKLPNVPSVSQAASRLQATLRTSAPPDQLSEIARQRLADIATELEQATTLAERYEEAGLIRSELTKLEESVEKANAIRIQAERTLDERKTTIADTPVSTALAQQARQLEALAHLGRSIGLRDGHCPLCESKINHSQLQHGVEEALSRARELDARAVDQAQTERARDVAESEFASADKTYRAVFDRHEAARKFLDDFDKQLEAISLSKASSEDVQRRIASLEAERRAIIADVRLIDTISIDQAVYRAAQDQQGARDRVARAERRLGRARLAETRAKAIYDATRRAAAETLDERLERVLPLMSELYRRLRPHAFWSDIEYSVRGDVRRFLKLQVGGDVNPQFVFSSGQRRATGLAFLLSVNLSIAWSKWRSILLDDPVQHVDDFRTVHLAEVLAHICRSGRQIVCAVEDSALADLMCRRLPTSEDVPGRRVTLGTDRDGALAIIRQDQIGPLSRRALVVPEQPLSA
jgi:chromosome segregation protein